MSEPICGTAPGRLAHIARGESPCEKCAAHHARYMRFWRRHRGQLSVPSVGVTRRLRALAVNGNSGETIADWLDWHPSVVRRLWRGDRDSILAVTHRKVDKTFQAKHLHIGTSRLTAKRAKRAGWVSVFAWDDIDDPNAQPIGVREAA